MSAHLVAQPATAHSLVELFPEGYGKVLVVQGNLADEVVSQGIADKGWDVTKVVAYLTIQLTPTAQQRDDALSADVLLLASSSAVSAWCDAFGTESPETVIAIGPSTASTATSLGLRLTAIAQDHSLQGLIEAAIEVIADR
jgi:uroporphyrinogen-III synthase